MSFLIKYVSNLFTSENPPTQDQHTNKAFTNQSSRGFTRNSKKKQTNNNKLGNNYNELYVNNDSTGNVGGYRRDNGLYNMNNGSNMSLRRAQSPSKQSIRSQRSQKFHQSHNNSNTNSNNNSSLAQQDSSKPPLFMCEPFIKTALVKGSYRTIVQLPKYVDYYEWLALNVFEFYTHLNKFYGVISEYVTPDKYPTMNADPKTEYVWVMPNGRTVSLPANQYIEYALTWISNKINDQTVFPTKSGMTFPPSFLKDVKGICRQMFRIIAHIYFNHFEKIVHLSLEAHWISFFSHFISFIREFDLVEKKELSPLAPLIENLEGQGRIIKVENPEKPQQQLY